MGLLSFFSRPPDNLGVRDGKLAPCPTSPNCVSTQAADEVHAAVPLFFEGGADEAMTRLKTVVLLQPRVRVVTATPTYLHAEFASRLLGFVDDVEFLLDPERKVIHFRSASRVGYSDLGVNRRRMETIRKAFVERK